jgi:hypothetical protein
VPTDDGFELQEDGRLQFSLLGATNFAVLRTTAKVDQAFAIQSFKFSLDPGTGPLTISGRLDGLRLSLDIQTAAGTRSEVRELAEPPALMLSLGRRLASEGLAAGTRKQWMIFDPATLKNSPVVVDIGAREVVQAGGRPLPAFKVQMQFSGIATTAWVTDTGEIVREESPMGLITVRESQEEATALAVNRRMQVDMWCRRWAATRGLTTRATCCGCACGWTAPTSRARTCKVWGSRSTAAWSSSSIRAACRPGRPMRISRATSRRNRSSKVMRRRFAPKPSA